MLYQRNPMRNSVLLTAISFSLISFLLADDLYGQGYNLYWGDLHSHTELSSDACGNIINALIFARDSSKLDFVGITDHDYVLDRRMQEFQWSQLRSACASFNQDGRFITFSGYEWTSPIWGHICVHFIRDDQPLLCHRDDSTSDPNKLIKYLDSTCTFIHYPHPMNVNVDWWNWNSNILIGAEVVGYNNYIFEYYNCPNHAPDIAPNSSLQDIVKAGYKVGFIGSSDTHIGHPGIGALTAVYADSLTRSSLFRALRARRFYATTGQRIEINFSINGHQMGEAFSSFETPRISFQVHSPSLIGAIEIIKNNMVLKTEAVVDTFIDGCVVDSGFSSSSCYYLRVTLLNGHKAWSSPIWIKSTNSAPGNFSIISPSFGNDYGVIWRKRSNIIQWSKSVDLDFADPVSYIIEWHEEGSQDSSINTSGEIWGTTYHFNEKLKDRSNYIFRLRASDGWGGYSYASPAWFRVRTEYWDENASVKDFGFINVSPNPFRNRLEVDLFSKKSSQYHLEAYNLNGEKIWKKDILFKRGGEASLWWKPNYDNHRLSAGIYFISLTDGRDRVTQKVICLP